MKATLRNKCNGSDAPSCRSSRTFARIHTFPLPFTNTNTDFADWITGLVIMDGLSICVTKCFALYMAEMAFNVHLPRADLDLRFVCSTLEPLIDFKFEVASSFLFVSTKYRQKHYLLSFCRGIPWKQKEGLRNPISFLLPRNTLKG